MKEGGRKSEHQERSEDASSTAVLEEKQGVMSQGKQVTWTSWKG